MMMIGQVFLAFYLAILLGLGISYFLPDFPGYASTLFANAMVIGQLCGNLLGGVMSHWVDLKNVFMFLPLSIFIGMILILFTKDQKFTSFKYEYTILLEMMMYENKSLGILNPSIK